MGLGASLQHFNPVMGKMIYETWHIDRTWKLLAQMPFGAIVETPADKPKLPLEGRHFGYGRRGADTEENPRR